MWAAAISPCWRIRAATHCMHREQATAKSTKFHQKIFWSIRRKTNWIFFLRRRWNRTHISSVLSGQNRRPALTRSQPAMLWRWSCRMTSAIEMIITGFSQLCRKKAKQGIRQNISWKPMQAKKLTQQIKTITKKRCCSSREALSKMIPLIKVRTEQMWNTLQNRSAAKKTKLWSTAVSMPWTVP